MIDPNYFHDVYRFHEKFGIGYTGPPRNLPGRVPLNAISLLSRVVAEARANPDPEDIARFRVGFLAEELLEYVVALDAGDLVKAFDALLDLVYVACGNAVFHGFPMNHGWEAVQAANMTKERAPATGSDKRGSSYDVVKPPGWTSPEPRLRHLLELAATNAGVETATVRREESCICVMTGELTLRRGVHHHRQCPFYEP